MACVALRAVCRLTSFDSFHLWLMLTLCISFTFPLPSHSFPFLQKPSWTLSFSFCPLKMKSCWAQVCLLGGTCAATYVLVGRPLVFWGWSTASWSVFTPVELSACLQSISSSTSCSPHPWECLCSRARMEGAEAWPT